MPKTFEFDFIGYSPEYGTTELIHADNVEHAENKALAYVKDTFPELQDVEITASRVIN